ncbi:hypothetical protein ACGC1H_000790 [Rhizoctonia solani]|uniref:RFX-type winged-helix domain-containing protein n=1 Tax=Rhizoctonia solani TaxID=456999 RepID=A0A8H3AP99_9AGAM|nr:unnamed protein product [Rhizoctonia solani]
MASPSLSMLAASVPFEHTHFAPSHSRSASAASNSSGFMSHEDLFFQHRHPHIAPTHTRHSSGASQSTSYSLGASLHTPADSPPSMANYKNHISRSTHIRRARATSSPYGRDDGMLSGSESLRSSSSEAEDMAAAFFAPDYGNMFVDAPGISPEAMQAAAGFGQMTLGPTQQLEQLAANVRAATTTSASDRAKQIFVQAWLTANYAPYADGNVPRQGLYNSYRNICDAHGIPHINTATLGKAIRLCFPAIKTRRLGVRGNSKYHYCGIRPVTATEVAFLQEFIRKSNQQAQLAMSMRAASSSQSGSDARSEDDDEDDESESGAPARQTSLNLGVETKPGTSSSLDDKTPTTNTLLSAAQGSRKPTDAFTPAQIRSRKNTVNDDTTTPSTAIPNDTNPYVVPPTYGSVRQMPGFPNIEEALGPNASVTSPQNVAAREVWSWFEAHLDGLMESVRTFRFDQFEIHLRTFWAGLSGDHREVVHAPAVAGLMAKADAMVFDEILEMLRSQVLAPIPPQALTSLRQLADKMEKILLVALENFGSTFVEPKVELGARFGHLVLRFLDIFQVTQALSSVLTNPKQLSDMRRSWRDIDFESVRNQSALVCNCRHEDLVQLLEVDFTTLLDALAASTEPVRDVMAWADNCCERLMGARNNGQEPRATMSSRSVLIRWQYVTSQIMRDLTIRSDPAFGAFQILKLFMDDWIALNVLRSVALSTNSVAASVEPVIQQQFFSMSPMGEQDHLAPPDFANAMDTRMQNHLTPTTSSMLAALNDSFPTSLDASASAFQHSGPYENLGFGQSSQPDLSNSGFGDLTGFDMTAGSPDSKPDDHLRSA